ncbi:hypothetical protein GW932_02030 [archaeon]|nr:hypothetical protein [archaeon]
MAALERVMQLKKEGKGEGEIIATLRAEGISPMEISDALNQSKIKEAVVDTNPTEGMNPSIMDFNETLPKKEEPTENVYKPEENYSPQPPQTMEQQYNPQQPMQNQGYSQGYGQESYPAQEPFAGYGQDSYAPQENYEQEEYYGGQEGYGMPQNTDTIIEVAEQVFEEKIRKITKELHEFREFKTIFETKVENINERLKRMEKSFDKMQLSILEKVGEYGKGLDYMKKELKMVEDSFTKVSGKL